MNALSPIVARPAAPPAVGDLAHQDAHRALAMRHTFDDGEINRRLANSAYARDTITTLLQKPDLSYAEVASHFINAAHSLAAILDHAAGGEAS